MVKHMGIWIDIYIYMVYGGILGIYWGYKTGRCRWGWPINMNVGQKWSQRCGFITSSHSKKGNIWGETLWLVGGRLEERGDAGHRPNRQSRLGFHNASEHQGPWCGQAIIDPKTMRLAGRQLRCLGLLIARMWLMGFNLADSAAARFCWAFCPLAVYCVTQWKCNLRSLTCTLRSLKNCAWTPLVHFFSTTGFVLHLIRWLVGYSDGASTVSCVWVLFWRTCCGSCGRSGIFVSILESKSYWKWWFIVDLPSYKMVVFHSYVNVYQRVWQRKLPQLVKLLVCESWNLGIDMNGYIGIILELMW